MFVPPSYACGAYVTCIWKIGQEQRKSSVHKQMYFSLNNDNAIAYIDLRSSAVRRFQKVINCLKIAK
jgi:hypothetical protein